MEPVGWSLYNISRCVLVSTGKRNKQVSSGIEERGILLFQLKLFVLPVDTRRLRLRRQRRRRRLRRRDYLQPDQPPLQDFWLVTSRGLWQLLVSNCLPQRPSCNGQSIGLRCQCIQVRFPQHVFLGCQERKGARHIDLASPSSGIIITVLAVPSMGKHSTRARNGT